VIRSIRIVGNLVWLGLLAGALALPLAAEEITVTIPPDDPPAQAEPAAQPAQPAPQPAASAPLPSYTPADHLQKSADSSTDAAAPTPPAAPVKHKKKAAAAAPAADASAAAPAATEAPATPVAADGAAKPAEKPKTAKAASPCLNLDENACGGNSLCIWVAAGTNDAGKATKARCRSLAMLKKEEAKGKAKAAAKGTTPEVLPWATNGAAAATPPAEGAAAATPPAADATKPAKKTKTAAVKKTPKPKPETVEATAPPPAQDAAPASAAGSAAEPDPQ